MLTETIPEYLRPYIVEQDASLYTPIDHASWRFIMKISRAFFAKHAHRKYLDGLAETGISSERIPLIEEMDQCLRKFNWRAVAVSGFIPPAVFMEFLSLGILPIACDMRTLEHLPTPRPRTLFTKRRGTLRLYRIPVTPPICAATERFRKRRFSPFKISKFMRRFAHYRM